MSRIAINCDLGESIGNDEAIMPYLDACSVACGGHIGDYNSMLKTVLLAKNLDVKVGAHPSFPDPEHFGRQQLQMDSDELYNSLLNQVNAFHKICQQEAMKMDHIKAHGALYNLSAENESIADVMLRVMENYPDAKLLTPWKSLLAHQAEKAGVEVLWEGFADRKYNQDRSLVNRSNTHAVISNPKEAVEQVMSVINTSHLTTFDGKTIPMRAHTFCIHGDNPAALSIAKALSESGDVEN